MPTKRTKPAAKADPLELEGQRLAAAFGAAVKAARERKGLTYRAGAEAAGVSLSVLQKIEAGGEVYLSIAGRVARRLGVSIDKAAR